MTLINLLFNLSLSLLIFGISLRVLSTSMSAFLGTRLQKALIVLTSNSPLSILTGAIATAFVQSSSTVNVLMVTLVNANLLNLYQAFGVVLGANIGTTVTAQIVSFNLSQYAIPMMLCGLFLFPWTNKSRIAGSSLIGLGGLFFGLNLIKQSLWPVLAYPLTLKLLISLSENIYLGIVLGIVFSAIIQSSSLVTTLVIALAQMQALNLQSAIAIALGSNIGTVATTLISSIGLSKEAKATAYADLLFNVLGVLFLLPFIKQFAFIISLTSQDPGRQVANAHTIFNVITAFLIVPFIRPLANLARRCAGI
ncbi:MAG: Na/Pi cotransporter family protein [Firmicutes bacterium]|nr:Na/Pi cotransporter family protein [Bacillota bacterium]